MTHSAVDPCGYPKAHHSAGHCKAGVSGVHLQALEAAQEGSPVPRGKAAGLPGWAGLM